MKRIITLILVLFLCYSAQAQLHGNKWRIGFSMGTTNYVGDIRPMPLRDSKSLAKLFNRYENYAQQFSYQASLEYALGNSVGLMLTAGSYQFGSGDRFLQNNGTLLTESPSFDRALNFQTNLYDAGLSFVFKPDNNWLLSGKSFIAPYFTLGIGVQTFDVSGDLLDANGNRYDYTDPNTIPDGNFETSLSALGTESTEGYDRTTLYANLGLGLRFRLSKSLEIFAQSDFRRAATDYLDDVSGQYRTSYDNDLQEYAAKPGTNVVTAENRNRGFNDGRGDWYIYHGFGLKFSFGANKAAFKPPVITQRYTYTPAELAQKQLLKENTSEKTPTGTGTTNNYFTIIQLPQSAMSPQMNQPLDSATLAQNQTIIDSLKLQKDTLNAELQSTDKNLSDLNEALILAEGDSSTSESVRSLRLENLESEQETTREKIIKLNSQLVTNQLKTDSLGKASSVTSQNPIAVDNAAMMQELIIYPGQVSRILYSANSTKAILRLDSADRSAMASRSNTEDEMMSRKVFEDEMSKLRSEMVRAQSKNDSAMVMTSRSRTQMAEDNARARSYYTEALDIVISQQGLDEKTAKKFQRNQSRAINAEQKARRQQEKIEKKNNRLLIDALLIGGTAAATAAIISNKKDKNTLTEPIAITPAATVTRDSTGVDSISTPIIAPILPKPEVRVDTVIVENERLILLKQAKIEVYFDTNQTTLSEAEIAKLAPLKELLNRDPDKNLELIGFADNTGSIAYNLALTEKRVESVKKILNETYQIPAERLEKGNGGLIVRGKSRGAQEQDRKVEIRLILN
jgi:outer membrane protein OmpA-like peptidoglycan-associated protein